MFYDDGRSLITVYTSREQECEKIITKKCTSAWLKWLHDRGIVEHLSQVHIFLFLFFELQADK